MKDTILKLTKKDFRWDYFNGSGKGGQNRNKNKNCVRCFHDPSGAMGSCQEYKERPQNMKKAFERMAKSEKFQKWLKLESMRKIGQLELIERNVEKSLLIETIVETKNDKNKWEKNSNLKITHQDIENIRE